MIAERDSRGEGSVQSQQSDEVAVLANDASGILGTLFLGSSSSGLSLQTAFC